DRADPPDPVVEAVGDVEIRGRGGIDRDAIWEVEIGLARVRILAAEAEPAGARHREDRTHGQHATVAIEPQAANDFTDPAVVGIGDEEVARRVDRESRRIAQRRLRRLFALIGGGIARGSGAGDGRHRLMRQVDRPGAVEMEASNTRTRLLPVSAITTSPLGRTATPVGALSGARTAGPPSPNSPAFPVPATVRSACSDVADSSRMALLPVSAM